MTALRNPFLSPLLSHFAHLSREGQRENRRKKEGEALWDDNRC